METEDDWGQMAIRLCWAVAALVGLLGLASLVLPGCYTSRLHSVTPDETRTEIETTGPGYGRRVVVIDTRGGYERCRVAREEQARRRVQVTWYWDDDEQRCASRSRPGSSGATVTPFVGAYGSGYYGMVPVSELAATPRTPPPSTTVTEPRTPMTEEARRAHAEAIRRVRAYMRTSYDPPAAPR